jgi:hypothetical protein
MALRALGQYINLLGRILPALRGTLPQKHVFDISTPYAAVMSTTCRQEVHPMMHLHKGQLVESNSSECSSCERSKRLGECPEAVSVRFQEKRLAGFEALKVSNAYAGHEYLCYG